MPYCRFVDAFDDSWFAYILMPPSKEGHWKPQTQQGKASCCFAQDDDSSCAAVLEHSAFVFTVGWKKLEKRSISGASTQEKVFFSFSGSMSCPDGSAVSGWYNLPGIPVTAGKYGGPIAATGVRLFCRSTALLSSCQPPTTPYCQGGGVVASISFDSNQFKLGCCKLQRFDRPI